jgi:hypothetical protein
MRTFIIVLGILALVIAAFAMLMLLGKSAPDTIKTVEDVSVEGVGTPESLDTVAGVGTLSSLQGLQKDLECQIMYTANDGKDIEGTYFVSGGKMRGDFVLPAPEFGGQIVSSMIQDGPMVYVWSEIGDDTYGFKRDTNMPAQDGRVESKEPVPMDADVRYSCSPWETVDGSVFTPPQTVNFKDVNAVLEAGMEYGTEE